MVEIRHQFKSDNQESIKGRVNEALLQIILIKSKQVYPNCKDDEHRNIHIRYSER